MNLVCDVNFKDYSFTAKSNEMNYPYDFDNALIELELNVHDQIPNDECYYLTIKDNCVYISTLNEYFFFNIFTFNGSDKILLKH